MNQTLFKKVVVLSAVIFWSGLSEANSEPKVCSIGLVPIPVGAPPSTKPRFVVTRIIGRGVGEVQEVGSVEITEIHKDFASAVKELKRNSSCIKFEGDNFASLKCHVSTTQDGRVIVRYNYSSGGVYSSPAMTLAEANTMFQPLCSKIAVPERRGPAPGFVPPRDADWAMPRKAAN